MKLLRNGLLTAGILLLSILMGMMLLYLAYLLPTEAMQRHLLPSAEILQKESARYPFLGIPGYTLDSHTDALMLLEAADADTEHSTLERCLLCAHLTDEAYPDQFRMTDFLTDYAQNPEVSSYRTTYARYWHGYQLWLKPLLLLTDYGHIRMILTVFQILLTLLTAFLLRKKAPEMLLPFLCVWSFLLPPACVCLEYASLYSLLLVCTCLLLQKPKQKGWFLFLCAGILTAYLDYLTYPAVLPGILMILHLHLQKDYRLRKACFCCIAWGLGYAGIWSGKWLLASLLTNENVLLDAFENAMNRTSSVTAAEQFSLIEVFRKNLQFFISSPGVAVLLLCAVILLFRREHRFYFSHEKIILLSMTALLPFLWYAILQNHSYVHAFMTSKDLCVTVFAGLVVLLPDSGIEKNSAHFPI